MPLSNTLAAHASLDQNDLDRLIESRIVDTVFELIVTSAADFEFRGDDHHPLVGGRNHTVDDLIAASRERLDRWREVATVLPSIAAVVTIAADVPSDAPDLVLSPGDWRIVAQLDGKRSIADITRLLGASAFDVCATLHRLVVAGAARVVS